MTNAEFQLKLQKMYNEHLTPTKRNKRTFNELCYVLRMDKEHDYNISIPPYKDDNGWGLIPSVKECFIPTRDLVRNVKVVKLDNDEPDFDGICLTVELE